MLFLVGSLAFAASLLVTREVPTVPLVLYAVGAMPIALRPFVPQAARLGGLVVLAVAVAWLSGWLFVRSGKASAAD